MSTTEIIRFLLLLVIIAMGLLGMFYLSRRSLGWAEYLAWGVFAAILPVLGPFLVIALRPGKSRSPQRR